MMNCKKHLSKSIFLLLIIIIVVNCSEEKKNDNYVAKVKDVVLTESDLNNALGEYQNISKYREEFIHEWIEREVLYQKALEDNLLNDNEFNVIMERTKKELAVSLLIKNYLKDVNIDPTYTKLKKYFEMYNDDFKLSNDLFNVNAAYFVNKESAVKFRTLVIESSWDNAVGAFKLDNNLTEHYKNKLIESYQLQTVLLQRILENLSQYEVSIAFEIEPNKYTVVQYIDKYNAGSLPPFEFVVDRVRDRFVVAKQKELVEQFKDNLMADYNTEIKRYYE